VWVEWSQNLEKTIGGGSCAAELEAREMRERGWFSFFHFHFFLMQVGM